MTDRHRAGHSGEMVPAATTVSPPRVLLPVASGSPIEREGSGVRLGFEAVYTQFFDFVWRSVRRLGVPEASVDDAVQEVFIVVHRRLHSFEGRSSLKTWLFGIALRVARDHRRAASRRRPAEPLRESLVGGPPERCPMEQTAKKEAARLLCSLLDQMDDDKRAVFVMAELEQMSAPEIAEALDVRLNTVYSRLRAARATFELAVQRHRARESGGCQ